MDKGAQRNNNSNLPLPRQSMHVCSNNLFLSHWLAPISLHTFTSFTLYSLSSYLNHPYLQQSNHKNDHTNIFTETDILSNHMDAQTNNHATFDFMYTILPIYSIHFSSYYSNYHSNSQHLLFNNFSLFSFPLLPNIHTNNKFCLSNSADHVYPTSTCNISTNLPIFLHHLSSNYYFNNLLFCSRMLAFERYMFEQEWIRNEKVTTCQVGTCIYNKHEMYNATKRINVRPMVNSFPPNNSFFSFLLFSTKKQSHQHILRPKQAVVIEIIKKNILSPSIHITNQQKLQKENKTLKQNYLNKNGDKQMNYDEDILKTWNEREENIKLLTNNSLLPTCTFPSFFSAVTTFQILSEAGSQPFLGQIRPGKEQKHALNVKNTIEASNSIFGHLQPHKIIYDTPGIHSENIFSPTSLQSSNNFYGSTNLLSPQSFTQSSSVPIAFTGPPLTFPDVENNRVRWSNSINDMQNSGLFRESEIHEISEYIFYGITLPLSELPKPITFENTKSVYMHLDEVRNTLKEYMEFGAVEEIDPPPEPQLIQPLHVVLKPGKAPRVCIDLSRNLNNLIPAKHFHYSSVESAVKKSKPNCWYAKLDISKCYLSFALAPSVRKYFTFSLDGKFYRFTRLPFGLSTGPRVCTLLLSVIAYELEKAGIDVVRYLDDFLFIADTKLECANMLTQAINIFQSFGLVINHAKTAGPAQQITFLGILIDSVNCTVECTQERIDELLLLSEQFQTKTIVRERSIESLIGKFSFAAVVLPGARPFMRRIFDSIKGKNHSDRIRIDKNFHADLKYWSNHLKHWNGRQVWRDSEPVILASDASLKGFGFYCEHFPTHLANKIDFTTFSELRLGAVYSGSYSKKHADFHASHRGISWCELFAALAALLIYAPLLKNQSVLLVVDNKTDVDIINRQSTRSQRLSVLLRAMFDLATKLNCSVKAVHRPGEQNVLADLLSRPELHQNDIIRQWNVTQPVHSKLFPVSRVLTVCSEQVKLAELGDKINNNYSNSSQCLVEWHYK